VRPQMALPSYSSLSHVNSHDLEPHNTAGAASPKKNWFSPLFFHMGSIGFCSTPC